MKIRSLIQAGLVSATSIGIALMTLMAFWLVVARYVVTNPHPYVQSLLSFMPDGMLRAVILTTTVTEELLRFALIWCSLIGATYVFSIKEHLAFGLLNEQLGIRLPALGKALNVVLTLLIIAFSLLVLVWGGWLMVSRNMRQFSPTLQLRMGLVYAILPLAGVTTCFLECFNLYDVIAGPPAAAGADDGSIKIGPLD